MYQWMLYQKSQTISPFSPSSVFDQTAELDAAIEAEADMDTPNAEGETGDYDADAIDAEDHEDNAPEQPE
jgi:hypothetical protein